MPLFLRLQEDPLEELLGPGSATSCGTALHWDESDELAQSILPGLFGEDTDIGASPFDMIDFGEPNKGAHGQVCEMRFSGGMSWHQHFCLLSRSRWENI